MPSEEFNKEEYIQECRLRAVLRRIDGEYLIDLEDEVQDRFEVLETAKFKHIEELSEEVLNINGPSG